jgi:hypothetical protein
MHQCMSRFLLELLVIVAGLRVVWSPPDAGAYRAVWSPPVPAVLPLPVLYCRNQYRLYVRDRTPAAAFCIRRLRRQHTT